MAVVHEVYLCCTNKHHPKKMATRAADATEYKCGPMSSISIDREEECLQKSDKVQTVNIPHIASLFITNNRRNSGGDKDRPFEAARTHKSTNCSDKSHPPIIRTTYDKSTVVDISSPHEGFQWDIRMRLRVHQADKRNKRKEKNMLNDNRRDSISV